MQNVVLSTGQIAVLRSVDELTEGQSRKIEIARARSGAVIQKFQKPIYIDANGEDTFDATPSPTTRVGVPTSALDEVSDEDWERINGFSDVLINEMTVSLDGSPVVNPSELKKSVYGALSDAVSSQYASKQVSVDGPDEKVNPLAGAVESTDSSSVNPI